MGRSGNRDQLFSSNGFGGRLKIIDLVDSNSSIGFEGFVAVDKKVCVIVRICSVGDEFRNVLLGLEPSNLFDDLGVVAIGKDEGRYQIVDWICSALSTAGNVNNPTQGK